MTYSDQETGKPPGAAGFEVNQVQVFEADPEVDKSAAEIAKACPAQETGEPPGGVSFEADQVQIFEADLEGDKSATEIAKVCTDQ